MYDTIYFPKNEAILVCIKNKMFIFEIRWRQMIPETSSPQNYYELWWLGCWSNLFINLNQFLTIVWKFICVWRSYTFQWMYDFHVKVSESKIFLIMTAEYIHRNQHMPDEFVMNTEQIIHLQEEIIFSKILWNRFSKIWIIFCTKSEGFIFWKSDVVIFSGRNINANTV